MCTGRLHERLLRLGAVLQTAMACMSPFEDALAMSHARPRPESYLAASIFVAQNSRQFMFT